MHTIVVGIFHTVRDAVVVGVAVQWVGIGAGVVLGIAAGLHAVGDAVAVAIGIRIIGIYIVDILDAIVVIIVVHTIDGAVAIEITKANGVVRHTGIGIVGVKLWVV